MQLKEKLYIFTIIFTRLFSVIFIVLFQIIAILSPILLLEYIYEWNFITDFKDFLINFIKGFFTIPYEIINIDSTTGIIFLIIEIIFLYYILIINSYKYNFIGIFFRKILDDLRFSFYFLKSTYKDYFRNKDVNILFNSLNLYLSTWLGVSYSSLNVVERGIIKNFTSIQYLDLYYNVCKYFNRKFKDTKNTNKSSFSSHVIKFQVIDNIVEVTLKIPVGFREAELLNVNKNDLKRELISNIDKFDLEIEIHNNIKIKFIKKENKKTIHILENYIKNPDFENYFYYGVDEYNNVISKKIDFNIGFSKLVVGKKGSGKSNFLSSIIVNAYLSNFYSKSPQFLISIADHKSEYSTLNLKGIDLQNSLDGIIKLVNNIKRTIDIRKKLFFETKSRNISHYNSKNNLNLEKILVLIDEYETLLDDIIEKKGKKVYESFIRDIGGIIKLGRSFGVNVQKALTSVIGSSAKDNLDVIVFRSEGTSELVALRGSNKKYNVKEFTEGEAIYFEDKIGDYKKFKAFYMSDEKLDNIFDKYGKKESYDIVKQYYNHALSLQEISFSKAKDFGLNDPQYRSLIKDKLNNNELIKLPGNKLVFTDNAVKYE